MKKNPVETVLGVLVLFVAVAFLYFAAARIDVRPEKGYALTAIFLKSGGLESGSDVRISGIKVGSVTSLKLTPDYTADITLNIKESVLLPTDTIASIATDGLMGGKFLQLEPGTSQKRLKNGDKIKKTRDFKSLEDIISEVIFLATGNDNK